MDKNGYRRTASPRQASVKKPAAVPKYNPKVARPEPKVARPQAKLARLQAKVARPQARVSRPEHRVSRPEPRFARIDPRDVMRLRHLPKGKKPPEDLNDVKVVKTVEGFWKLEARPHDYEPVKKPAKPNNDKPGTKLTGENSKGEPKETTAKPKVVQEKSQNEANTAEQVGKQGSSTSAEDKRSALTPLQSTALSEELQNLVVKVRQELPDAPEDYAEMLVADTIRHEICDDIKNILGLNVTKRLLKIHNRLYVKLQFTTHPEAGSMRAFIDKYRICAVKPFGNKAHLFAAKLRTVQDYDVLCSEKEIVCGSARVTVTPCCKSSQCSSNLGEKINNAINTEEIDKAPQVGDVPEINTQTARTEHYPENSVASTNATKSKNTGETNNITTPATNYGDRMKLTGAQKLRYKALIDIGIRAEEACELCRKSFAELTRMGYGFRSLRINTKCQLKLGEKMNNATKTNERVTTKHYADNPVASTKATISNNAGKINNRTKPATKYEPRPKLSEAQRKRCRALENMGIRPAEARKLCLKTFAELTRMGYGFRSIRMNKANY